MIRFEVDIHKISYPVKTYWLKRRYDDMWGINSICIGFRLGRLFVEVTTVG